MSFSHFVDSSINQISVIYQMPINKYGQMPINLLQPKVSSFSSSIIDFFFFW